MVPIVKKAAVNPPSVFRSLEHGFSQAVIASGTRTLYVSGQTAAAVSRAFRDCFSGDVKPASTWIGVAALADPDFLIEVEATAVFD